MKLEKRILKHAGGFVRFRPDSMRMCAAPPEAAQAACERMVSAGKLVRSMRDGEVWYGLPKKEVDNKVHA